MTKSLSFASNDPWHFRSPLLKLKTGIMDWWNWKNERNLAAVLSAVGIAKVEALAKVVRV
ncbi:MAG: hypothetical protein WCP12_14970 [bacterium]